MRLIAIPLLFLAGAIASHSILAHHPQSISVDLAQPLVVATTWHAYGIAVWFGLTATIVAAGIAYIAVLRTKTPSLATTIGVSVLAMIAGFLYVPIFSSDVYAYAAYGEMARLGLDPYARTMLPHGNALFDAAIWQWHNPLPLCVYGEAFVGLARFLGGITAPLGVVAQLNALRIAACVALLLCAPLMYVALDSDRVRRQYAAAFIALNPVAIWSAVEGHNDTIMLAIVLAGFALLRRGGLLGACVVALGALIKAPALLAAGGLAVNAIVKQQRSLRTLSGVAAGLILVAIFSLPWVEGVRKGVLPHGTYEPLTSPQGFIVSLGRLAFPSNTDAAGALAAIVGAAGFAVLIVIGVRKLRERGADAWCYFALAAWIAIPNPYPWYTIWILPLGAVARDARLRAAILAVSFTSLLRYVPDAVDLPGPALNLALSAVTLLPYGLLVTRRRVDNLL